MNPRIFSLPPRSPRSGARGAIPSKIIAKNLALPSLAPSHGERARVRGPHFPLSLSLSLSLSLALLLLPTLALADQDTLSTTFDQANKLYEQGHFSEAAAVYQQIILEGRPAPSVYFNLGNAYLKNGQIGRAILNYRLAQKLAPRDPDIRTNLEFARSQVPGPASSPNSGRWFRLLTLNELTVPAALAFWTLIGLNIVAQLRPEQRPQLQRPQRVAAGIAFLFITWLFLAYSFETRQPNAVVIVPEAVARYGPLEESQKFFTLQDGHEIQMLDQKSLWRQIRDASGRKAWLPETQIAPIPELNS
jgi:tetratricopeptide (TPR) repeat protein